MKIKSSRGPLIINLKNYLETAGENTMKIIKDVEKVNEKIDVEIIVSPPQPSLALVASQTSLKIISQHIDIKKSGSSTGYYIPEIIQRVGAFGSIINHSEHEIKIEEISLSIEKLRELNLISIVCIKSAKDLKNILDFNPNYIAIEPPELIGTQKSISTERPYLITECSNIINDVKSESKLICGAGISTKVDVKIALENGSSGILVSSSITKSLNWYDKIFELASAFVA